LHDGAVELASCGKLGKKQGTKRLAKRGIGPPEG
jgi:hypothetical protein